MAGRLVRVMGANVADDQPDKAVVLVHLGPMHVNFYSVNAFSTYKTCGAKEFPHSHQFSGTERFSMLYIQVCILAWAP